LVVRTLTASDLDAAHEAFLDAFSDYVVPLAPPRDRFLEMLRRRGVVPEASVAIFDDERMVAFTLNGIDGDRAYDSGTGVAISHRRRGLARKVMEASIDVLQQRGCTSYVLEVLDSNTRALELYRSLDFEVTRTLQCFTFDQPAAAAEVLASARSAWQNSDASVARAADEHVQIGDTRGHVILFPETGDLAQFHGVITTDLLARVRNTAQKPLRIMNVDESDAALIAFLETAGATRTVRQFEMVANFVLAPGDETARDAEQHPGGGGR
jgi:ribosomal protein S18 acetylase RimI-like enzyme